MAEGKRQRVVVSGVVSIMLGFGLDMLSQRLATRVIANIGGTNLSQANEAHAQAYSHLGLALMLFGFALIAAVVHTWLQAPPKRET